MTKHHFNRMKQAAFELVRLTEDPKHTPDPDLLAWARQIVLQNQAPPPFKPSPNQNAILQLLEDAPFDGLTAEQISAKTGKPKNLTSATLGYMTHKAGLICAVKLPTHAVYFRDAAALAIGKPLVLAAEERRQALRQPKATRPLGPSTAQREQAKRDAKAALKTQRELEKQEKKRAAEQLKETQRLARRAERAAKNGAPWSARNQPRPKHHQGMQIKSKPANVTIAPPRKPSINQSVFIPPGLQVQQLPSGRDTRFDVDPNSEGAGFSAEWRRLRG